MISKKGFWVAALAFYVQAQAFDNKPDGTKQSKKRKQLVIAASGYSIKIRRLLEINNFQASITCSDCFFCAAGTQEYVQKELNQHYCHKKKTNS